MIIYFCDRQLNILGQATTDLPEGFRVSDDKTVEDVESGVNTFEGTITWTEDTRADLTNAIQTGYFILKSGKNDENYNNLFQIIETEADTKDQSIRLYAEDAGLDLLNTQCEAVTLTSMTISQMITSFKPADWTLNVQDAPTTAKTNTWDGESTCTERLRSVAGLWDCELYYSFRIEGLQVKEKIINVVKRRGLQEAIPQLRLNYDIDRIVTKTSIADLVTALKVTGGTPDGSSTPINLVGYSYSYTDPDTGDVYQVDTTTGQMRNVTAMDRWSSMIDEDGLWVGSFSFDTTDKATLAGQARAELQKLSVPAVNYEVDFAKLPDDIQIGDRVNIIDDDGELYLEARILKIETCEAEQTQTATIGEYLLKTANVSEKLLQMAADLEAAREQDQAIQEAMTVLTETVDNMFTLEVESEVVLETAYLTARLLKGNEDIKTNYDPDWFKWILRSENGEKLLGRGYTLTVDMDIIGYASTILCRFIRPELYDLTDHNLVTITDENLEAIQVSFAGIYNQPVVATRSARSKKLLRATTTTEVGNPTVAREVNLYERGNVNETLQQVEPTVQRFWVQETGLDAGAHITEVTREEFIASPQGGNLLARSNGIAVRDGLIELATFGADGMRVGREDEKNILITPTSFIVTDEDMSMPFYVRTEGSARTATASYVTSVSGTSGTYYVTTFMTHLKGELVDDKLTFGTSTSGYPTSFGSPITLTDSYQTVTVDGVRFSARYYSDGIIQVYVENTTNTLKYVGYQKTERYRESEIVANGGVLTPTYHKATIVDSTGTSIPAYCYVYTYGRIACLSISVYNTNSVIVGGVLYAGTLLNHVPITAAALYGRAYAKNAIIGSISSGGEIWINNTGQETLTLSSSSSITLYATYIYQA